eukprot:COSAG06_NODE_11613_length_1485_cov_1.888889_2_plen_143_part_00
MEGANALALGPAHPDIALLEDKAVAELTKDDFSCRTAASEATLSGDGLHAARFTVRGKVKRSGMFFGLIRADWDALLAAKLRKLLSTARVRLARRVHDARSAKAGEDYGTVAREPCHHLLAQAGTRSPRRRWAPALVCCRGC